MTNESVSEMVVSKVLRLECARYAQEVQKNPRKLLVEFAEMFDAKLHIQPLSKESAIVFIGDVVFDVSFDWQSIHYAGTWNCRYCKEIYESTNLRLRCRNIAAMMDVVFAARKKRCEHKVVEVDSS